MKNFLKLIGKNIPVFLFCVFFILGYNTLFGPENTTIGVFLLTALFIFLKNDLGYSSSHATLILPILLLLSVCLPKLALINPWIGLPIHLVGIFTILTLSSYAIKQDNHVAFLLGYIFASGYDVTGILLAKRILSVLIGGLLIAALYWVKNHKQIYSATLKNVVSELDIHSKQTQWYLKLTIVLSFVMFAGSLLHFPNTKWISFTVLSLTYHNDSVRIARTKHRIPATILGSLLFLLVFGFLVPVQYQSIVLFAAGFIIMFLQSYGKKTSANSFNSLATAVTVFPTGEAVFLRILSNVLGVMIAFINHHIMEFIYRFHRQKPTIES